MTAWKWTDMDRPLGRWGHWWRSAEFLTTLFLWFYTVVLLSDGPTIRAFPAFAWLFAISGDHDERWAMVAFTLALVAPLAVAFDVGRMRCMSLVAQGTFFLFLGTSALVNSPNGLGWATFLASGLWLYARSLTMLWHHDFLLSRTRWSWVKWRGRRPDLLRVRTMWRRLLGREGQG